MANLRANRIVSTTGSNAITGSVEFDGTGDYLSLSSSSDFAFGTGDFTVEGFINRSTLAETDNVIDCRNGSSGGWKVQIESDGDISFYSEVSSGFPLGSDMFRTIAHEWYHFAFTRSGGTLFGFMNGVLITSASHTSNYSTSIPCIIGARYSEDQQYHKGFISNLRVIKGTALYTSNFIPPTRNLTKLPGTVLLCCQDSNDPTTEATGKTITGYGDLVQVGISTNLADSGSYTDGSTGSGVATFVNNVGIITGTDSSNRGILYKTVSVIQGNKYEFSFRSTDASTNGKAGVDSNDGTNDVLDDVTNTPDLVYFSGSTVPNLDTTTGLFRQTFTATTNEAVLYFQEIGAGTLQVTDITLTAIDGRKGSDFTPSVGSDDSVEFAGPTTINTENYFYLPTGPTEQRGRGRGLFSLSGGAPAALNSINYIQISSSGNPVDFGDLSYAGHQGSAVSSLTRGIFNNGNNPGDSDYTSTNVLDYVTIATTGNSVDFGDLTTFRYGFAPVSNSTRGVFVGGLNEYVSPYPTGGAPSAYTNTMDYITMATLGNAIEFGDSFSSASSHNSATCSSTRGVYTISFNGSSNDNSLYYITIATTGNGQDFGNLSYTNGNRQHRGVVSNGTRGIFAGALVGPAAVSNIDHITIASLGDGQDFGDLTLARRTIGGTSNSVRGVFAGGYDAPPGPSGRVNIIDYITIASTGDAQDFGDLIEKVTENVGCSDSHGGLG